ncbi:MAG: 2-hydroxyacid dehydrogenase [Firmicutes bacterium]|nr:2-hydroxyacid dehydrogenase [Bacillota bacterium]
MIVALAGTYPNGTFESFRERLPEDVELLKIDTPEKYAALDRADVMILRIFRAEKADIERIKGLKMISRWGVGYDSVDVAAASSKGILVTNTPGSNAYAVAEHSVLLMLALCHHLTEHNAFTQKGDWSNKTFLETTRTLNDAKVGLIGGGNVGRQVAKRVQAFGASVQYFDPYRLSEEMEKKFDMEFVSLDELLRTSDFISVHAPLTDENYHMIGEEAFAKMKPTAIVINTARGGLIDEAALIRAIDEGRIAGAGIDCIEKMPLTADEPLLGRGNIIVTPHVAGTSNDIATVTIPMLVDTIMDLYKGGKVRFVVNKAALEAAGYELA